MTAMIVDSQVHVSVQNRTVTSANAHPRRLAVFSKDDLLQEMHAAGADRAILVPPSRETNDHALEAARLHPERFVVMGRMAIEQPDSRRLLDDWLSRPGMLGLRLVFNTEHAALLTEGKADWIWPLAERAGLPVMLLAPGLLPHVASIAERYPLLRLIVDHMRVPRNAKGADAFAQLHQLLALSRFPNVAVKASGLPGYSAEAYPFTDLHQPLRETLAAFGSERVFRGVDLSRMPCPYCECVTCFTETFSWPSDHDRRLLMGEALCTWIGWALPGRTVAVPRPNASAMNGAFQ